MENATKFLIIAGAILIAIVLISVGMMLVNGAQGAIDESLTQMDQQQRQTFNRQFSAYEGSNVSGSQVKSLIDQIVASNNNNVDKANRQISIAISGITVTSKSATSKYSETNLKLYEGEIPNLTFNDTAAAINNFATSASYLKNAINTGLTYEVIIETNPSTGLVYLVNITNPNASNGN